MHVLKFDWIAGDLTDAQRAEQAKELAALLRAAGRGDEADR